MADWGTEPLALGVAQGNDAFAAHLKTFPARCKSCCHTTPQHLIIPLPNKKMVAVAERLETLGCDPIEGMTRIAMDKHVELGLRAQMYKELAQYVAPKRKAVEVTGEDGGPSKGTVMPTAFLEQLTARQ